MIRCETELDLLEQVLEILQRSDPDILVSCDCGFQFDVLMNKIFALKIRNWSRVGKLKRLTPPFFKVDSFKTFSRSTVILTVICLVLRVYGSFDVSGKTEFRTGVLRPTDMRHSDVGEGTEPESPELRSRFPLRRGVYRFL